MRMFKTSIFAVITGLLIVLVSCSSKNEDKKEAAKNYMKNQTVNYQEAKKPEPKHSEHLTTITDKNFSKTIKNGVTLVDFWATWCKPCLMQGPIIDQLADELKDRATIGKMDVDINPNVPRRFNVANIPTIMIFKDGQMVERFVGLQSKEMLLTAIEKHLES